MPENAETAVDSSQSQTDSTESEATQPVAANPEVEKLLAELERERTEKALVVKNNAALLNEKKTQYEKAAEALKGEEKFQALSEMQATQIAGFESQAAELASLKATNDSNFQLATRTVEARMVNMPDHVKKAVETMPGWAETNPFDQIQKIDWLMSNIPDPAKTAKVIGGGQPAGTTSTHDQALQKVLEQGTPAQILEFGLNDLAANN